MYDESADRWFMSQLAYPGGPQGFHQCIAISQTSDPTGAWFRYDFLFSGDTLNDYPKFGAWPDAYYASSSEFLNGAQFTGVTVQAYERAKMLAGQDAGVVSFHIGDSSGIYSSLLPTDAEGGALGFNPPSGAPNPFFMMDDDAFGFSPTDRVMMWDFHVDWTTPANSTSGLNGAPNRFFETAPFDSQVAGITQPNTGVKLEDLSDRLLFRAAYRNLGNRQAVALNHDVDVNGNDHVGPRWYVLSNSGSGWGLEQQGTYAPDSDNRWFGSTALDASGDLAIGYSVSSSSTFPSIRVAGRLVSDPAGQLSQGENEMIAGGGSQTHPAARWGDYSDLQVDPTDGCTFWYTTEYLQQTSVADWHTRIGSFKFPSCTAGPHGTLTGTVTDAANNAPIAGATVSTSVATTTTDAQGKYTLTLPANTYDVSFSAFGYATKTVSGVVITDGGTTTLNAALSKKPSVHVTGTVTDGSGHGYPLYARIDVTGRPGGPIYTDPVTGKYSVDLPQSDTYEMKFTSTLPGYRVVTDQVVVGTTDVTHNVAIPVQAACTAPGYTLNRHLVFNEPFSGATFPPGWTVVDNIGEGHVWQINDPEGQPNNTGGDGNFADINSDFYGGGNTQNTELISPTIDLSSVGSPILRFHNNYIASPFFPQVGDVDVSIDAGTTWTNVWHHEGDSVPGPSLQEVSIPQAAGQSNVKVRYHFTATFGFWWMVDDVSLGAPATCDPVPGGLVVGNVNDANTSSGINGAKVTSVDKPADNGTTMATPDDPNVGEGYYWLFSSLTGSHPFAATKAPYQAATKTVNVAADGTVRADFTLNAGRLVIDPQSLSRSLVLGTTGSGTVKITNNGTASADVKLSERAGSFQLLTLQGSQLRLVRAEADRPFSPGFLGDEQGEEEEEGADAGPPRDPTWSAIANYPTVVMDNGADTIDGKLYSVGGLDAGGLTAKGYVYDPATDAWSPIPDMPVAREKPAVAAVNGKLYVTGGWDTNGNPIARTDVYDPGTDSWATVAPNPKPTAAPGAAVADGKIYLVGGCKDGNCTTGTDVVSYDPATDAWDPAHAAYPHNDAWESCGGINGKVYCAGGTDGGATFKNGFVLDPAANSWSPIADMPLDLWASAAGAANGMLVVSAGVTNGFSTVTNQGVIYDPSADAWSALPNAQFPRYRSGGSCGFYKVGGSSGGFAPSPDSERLSEPEQCGVTDVPWLDESPTSATLQPGQSVTVTINLSATTAKGVLQPGAYTAQLGVASNTPYKVDPIGITMNVTPPKDWGKIAGTVQGTDCKGTTAPLKGVQIQATGNPFSYSTSTDTGGKYGLWGPEKSNPYTLIASKDGWVSQSKQVKLKKGNTTTVNFTLLRVKC